MEEEKEIEKESESAIIEESIEKEIEDNKKSKKEREKQNKQILWAIVLMLSIIIIVVAVPFITKNFVNKFVYITLDFQKTKLGDLIFYSTRVPIANKQAQITGSYSMNFREDPRKLDHIEVDVPGNAILFKKDQEVYITLDPEMNVCEDSAIGMINLAGFIKDFAGFNVSSGFIDEEYANQSGFDYVTCKNHPNNTIISVSSGNQSQIKKYADRCYELTYADCEINQVSEKFMLLVLEKYMEYFVRG